MMSIFNIFDPSNNLYFSLNWTSMIFPLMFIISDYWMILSRWNILLTKIFNYIFNELKIILINKIFSINFISIFMTIFLINFLGLFSYIFTGSAHLTTSFSLSFPFWLSFIILGWMFNTMNLLSHQTPLGTPYLLMPLMVLIELISNIIRPGTLSVRLTANMIAGHLLLTLLSENSNKVNMLLLLIIIFSEMLLMTLELAVSIIQAYVFTILLSLYSQEI